MEKSYNMYIFLVLYREKISFRHRYVLHIISRWMWCIRPPLRPGKSRAPLAFVYLRRVLFSTSKVPSSSTSFPTYHTSLRLLPVLQHTVVSSYSWFHSNADTGFLALRNDRPSFPVVGSRSSTWLTVVINMVHSLYQQPPPSTAIDLEIPPLFLHSHLGILLYSHDL
jgi:hypothetical protein